MAAAIEQIATTPVLVYGHSLGGVVAVSLAQRRPELVSGLLLGDPPIYLGDPAARARNPVTSTFPGFVQNVREWQATGVTASDLVAQLEEWSSSHEGQALADRWLPGVPRAWSEALLAFDPGAMDAAISGELWAGFDPDQRLQCPAIMLRADQRLGPVVSPEDGQRFIARVPGATVLAVAEVDHWLHMDRDGYQPVLDAILLMTAHCEATDS